MIWFLYIYEFTWISTLCNSAGNLLCTNLIWLQKRRARKCSISSHKHIKTVNSVEELMCHTAGLIFSRPCVECFWDEKKKNWAVRAVSHPCGTWRKIISTITWWKRKCNLRKSTVKEHLRPQQAVPKHMLLRCFQQCSIFSPCRRKDSIYRHSTLMVTQDGLRLCSFQSGLISQVELYIFLSSGVLYINLTIHI